MKIAISIIRKDNRFLLVKRVKNEENLNWVFPGGKQEFRETLEETALREVREETGIECEIIGKLGYRIHPDTGTETYYFSGIYISGNINISREDEILEAGWYTKDEILKRITTDIYPRVEKYISQPFPAA